MTGKDKLTFTKLRDGYVRTRTLHKCVAVSVGWLLQLCWRIAGKTKTRHGVLRGWASHTSARAFAAYTGGASNAATSPPPFYRNHIARVSLPLQLRMGHMRPMSHLEVRVHTRFPSAAACRAPVARRLLASSNLPAG